MNDLQAFSAGSPPSNTILIIDDDPINRKVLGKLLMDYYHIKEAGDGNEGLVRILAPDSRFCAILLDVMMPGMNGIEVLRCLKSFGTLERIPVFLITAESGAEIMREAYDLGVMDVISKPIIPYVVLRRVRSVIELFEARRHLSLVVENQSRALLEQAEKIIRLNQGMIEALATAIEFRNEESGGHVQRICAITRMFLENTAFGADLDEKEIENIALASIMHDVGKITIPDAVLCKPGKLTAEEYEVMKSHTTKGVSILESVPQLRDSEMYSYACDIARHHHERWDGRGYPDGLKEEEITIWSQVVALADVYDALNCRRAYKPPFPREEAVRMIVTGQCGVFNPRLLESFLDVEDRLYGLYRSLPEAQGA